ncbi:hypothetical protein ACTACG_17180 [Pseudomonas syringae]|uniref:hypothetical protein n=1 Tax=Pseudomonas syringae TaxID=317 RepID=UPI000E32CEE1|nr:hypothetical protein [Pseudomonas syringae]
MTEFNNRIEAQRTILHVVNSKSWVEQLFGLSTGAIDRWVRTNGLSTDEPLVVAVYDAAGKLFFLANKSQEQVTEEYKLLSQTIEALIKKISSLLEFR